MRGRPEGPARPGSNIQIVYASPEGNSDSVEHRAELDALASVDGRGARRRLQEARAHASEASDAPEEEESGRVTRSRSKRRK